MGKINKKLIENKKKSSLNVIGLKKKYNIKDCVVKLNRINIEKVEKFDFNINVRIRKNVVNIGKKQLFLTDPAQRLNISLGIQNCDIVMKCCNIIKPKKVVVKSLNNFIDDAWRKIKMDNIGNEVRVGDIVLAKMTGFKPWPAKVESFTKNKAGSRVFFFGTNNRGPVRANEIVQLERTNDVIRLLLLRNNLHGFLKGVIEAERILGIPQELSVTNEQKSIT